VNDTRVSGAYTFTGPAEVVFDVLTDPDRAARWLPPDVHPESVTVQQVTVREGTQRQRYGVEIVPDDLRVSWHPLDGTGPRGGARVEDGPSGGSVLHAEVTAPGADEQTVQHLLDEAMRNLQRDVSDNFNAG
jgi:uncharacterized protein YndB with AHSA1/START domain